MSRQTVSSPFVLRYVYAMLAVVLVAMTAIVGTLYVDQSDDSRTRERVQSFHLESYKESEQLLRDVDTLQGLVEEASQGTNHVGVAGIRGTPIGYGGLLEAMHSRLLRLAGLQSEYAAGLTAQSLQRLLERFERIEASFVDARVGDDTGGAIVAFSLSIDQFRRLHTIAADFELQALADRHAERPRFLAVLVICLVVTSLAIGYLIYSLRAALDRQKEAEIALADAQERLHNIQKLDALAQLVGGVAHDFNNLLTTVLGHTELLRETRGTDDSLRTGLDEIRTAGLRAAGLTRQLLAFSRRQHTDRSVVDLNDVIRDMEPILRRTLGDDIRLECRYAVGAYPTEIDQGQFHQVLMNLASNARDAMPNGGKLALATENIVVDDGVDDVPDGQYLKLTLVDSGVGMDAETRRRAFEPFFSTKDEGHGTGLGLSTVHGIVSDSGGFIVLDSRLGDGTTFRIYFPRAEGLPQRPSTEPTTALPQKGSETILVVDDDEQVLRFVQKGLASLGYRVLSAPDGASGLDICKAEAGPIDVIVTDVVMSGMNGPQFLASAQRLRPDAAAVYMSAYTKDIILWRANEGDEIPLVTKPFELETLARVIRQTLEQLDSTETRTGDA